MPGGQPTWIRRANVIRIPVPGESSRSSASRSSTGGRIRRIGVVIPARDEQALVEQCLRSIRAAASEVTVPVSIVVVADSCRDETVRIARRAPGVEVIEVRHRVVGMTRAVGMNALIDRFGASGTWLATTDADSVVPATWLSRQLARAAAGADAVVGTVQVLDWSGHPRSARRRYARAYSHVDGHGHVHGANLSVRAAAYESVGGFPALATHEDVALVGALCARGYRVDRAGDLAVGTSGRTIARAPAGFAGYLRALH
jgi:glycosyltransferase involved in cell wall biosynthesis